MSVDQLNLDAFILGHDSNYAESDCCACFWGHPDDCHILALIAEVRRLRAEVARKRPPEQIARNRQTASGGSAVTITTTPPQPQMIPVPVQMHRCPRCGYGR